MNVLQVTNATLISFIVPVYNVRDYLLECIKSIIVDHSPDIEVILIDDGSTDGSGDICDLYALEDTRIKVIHKRNEGVSIARNVGLEVATGKWIWFVDADDYIVDGSVSCLRRFMQIPQYDTIIHGLNILNGGEFQIQKNCKFTRDNKNAILKRIYCYQNGMILFSRNVISDNGLRFSPDIKMGEDLEFQYKYLINCSCPVSIGECYYVYRQREGSAIRNSATDYNNMCDCMAVSRNMLDYIIEHNVKSMDWLELRIQRMMKKSIQAAAKVERKRRGDIGSQLVSIVRQYDSIGFSMVADRTIRLACWSINLYFVLLRAYQLFNKK